AFKSRRPGNDVGQVGPRTGDRGDECRHKDSSQVSRSHRPVIPVAALDRYASRLSEPTREAALGSAAPADTCTCTAPVTTRRTAERITITDSTDGREPVEVARYDGGVLLAARVTAVRIGRAIQRGRAVRTGARTWTGTASRP